MINKCKILINNKIEEEMYTGTEKKAETSCTYLFLYSRMSI